ncbi:MAG: ATP-binding protein [Nanoarchaeota archaeon]|nr:ATP-binding protein [Nanoarchaeota archaeon]MBU1704694.1 ATP-binding protein [Nanoarchaeota archaeon]
MKKITILSGKGGVGKSSIIASLAVVLSANMKIIAADCDVDASNLALVLGVRKHDEWKSLSTNLKARIDYSKCTNCKRCFQSCYFHAIDWETKPTILAERCEGCGVCVLACPEHAIMLEKAENAKIGYADTKYGFKVVSAQLNIGESGSGKVVSEVRRLAEIKGEDSDIMLIDAAAGIGCPVIASVTGVNHVVAVTEPTPSGMSDLKRALQLVEHFNIPCSIIINKFDINPVMAANIEGFARAKHIDIIGKIPYDKQFVDALVKLTPIVDYNQKYLNMFNMIAEKIIKKIQ